MNQPFVNQQFVNLPLEMHIPVVYSQQQAGEIIHNENLSQQQIIRCFENGAVWLESHNSKPVRLYDDKTVLTKGQHLHLYCNQSTLAPCPYQPELVGDFTDFSIWDKPSGMLSQGSKWGDHWTLHRWIKQHPWPARSSFITHRLDRFTQGLMIVSHTESINRHFHRLFESRDIHKTYRAIVSGLMQPGEYITIDSPIDGKKAETTVHVLAHRADPDLSLLEIKPISGRKHQLRIHLAEIGHPVVNDRQFGAPPFEGDLMLQASELDFNQPTEQNRLQIKLATEKLLTLKIT